MRTRLESVDEKRTVRWATKQGILVWKLNVIGRRGLPDRVFLMPPGSLAKVVFIEFKREGKKARLLQERTHKELASRSIPCYCVDTYAAAIEILTRYLSQLDST